MPSVFYIDTLIYVCAQFYVYEYFAGMSALYVVCEKVKEFGRSPRIGVTDGCVSLCGYWGSSQGILCKSS